MSPLDISRRVRSSTGLAGEETPRGSVGAAEARPTPRLTPVVGAAAEDEEVVMAIEAAVGGNGNGDADGDADGSADDDDMEESDNAKGRRGVGATVEFCGCSARRDIG